MYSLLALVPRVAGTQGEKETIMPKLLSGGARIAIGLGVALLSVVTTCLLHPARASAQSALSASIAVPLEGLFFRAPDGRVLARLSSGPDGSVFELYDAQGRPTTAVRGGTFSPPMRRSSGWTPGELSEGLADPWVPDPWVPAR
jgi:hypothetical protein